MRPAALLPRRGSADRLLLELDLGRGLLEAPPTTPVDALRARHRPLLRTLVEGLRKAADDASVVGLVAHVGRGQPTLAQSGELRAAVQAFRRSGKPAVCWAETFGELGPGNVAYHLATAFDEIWLQPSGDVGLTGIVAEAVFVRDALNKLGVDPQIGKRHEYKTAADTLLRSAMTDAHREMAARLVESAMATIVDDVAAARGLDADAVRAAVDRSPLAADDALSAGLVDRVGYRDEVYADLHRRLGRPELRYVDRYTRSLVTLAENLAGPIQPRRKPVVALVQASGPIHLGRSGTSPLAGPSAGSDTVGAALRAAARDDTVKAVVLRVDSPGGSYVAADAIRREVIAVRGTGKPVIASMASVAASGGYYIAMAADVVLASAGTLTGSIGVLAGKQVIRDALARIGVARESVSTGTYAEMFSTQRPFSDDEWRRLDAWLDRVYDDFTAKAAQDRHLPLDRLRELARGRVWTGADAHAHGLVDQLGGLAAAVDVACARAGLRRADVDVRPVPRLSPLDRLRPAENSEHPAAAAVGWASPAGTVGESPLDVLARILGLPAGGVLTAPVVWRLG